MAETVAVSCPECGKKMKVRPDTLGKKIRCKGCDEVFVAADPGKAAIASKPTAKPDPKAKPALPGGTHKIVPFKEDDEEEGSNPYAVTETETSARCPECANEMESAEAIVCLHCGYNTQTRVRIQTRITVDVTPVDYFAWLIPGIACVVAAIVLLTGDIIYCIFIEEWLLGSWWDWLGNFFFKFWGSIICAFAIFYLARFAVDRLIINSTPPEIETKKK